MLFKSPLPEIRIPTIPLTPFVFEKAEQFGDKPAFIEATTGRSYTFHQLTRAIRYTASGLCDHRLRKGDVVALYLPNIPEYAIAFHAVSLLGGMTTTVNPLYTAEELSLQLSDSNTEILITIPPLLEKAREAARGLPVRKIFVIGEDSGADSFHRLMHSDGSIPDTHIDPKEDLVALPYSSGTTGVPKGVMLTHFNLVANLLQIEAAGIVKAEDTLICVLPFFHIYGLVVIMNTALHLGATVVMLPRFDLDQMLLAMQNYKVTLAPVVPPILLALTRSPNLTKYDLSSVKTIFSAAAPLSENLTAEFLKRFPCVFKQGYGMTEASPATHMAPDDPAQIKHGTVGFCVPNTVCTIRDPVTSQPLGIRQEGEVCVRGPQVMKGYLNRPDATAQTIDAEGWLHTGDIGFIDEEGHLHIVDRVKELIKYKGFQVAPAELEAVLLSHSEVKDAAVVPFSDDEAGEVPKAFVVLKSDVSPDELMAFVAERVAPYKKIRVVERIEAIPKSPSGKILRKLLIQRDRK